MTLLDNKLKILPIWMMIMHITMDNGAVKKILHLFLYQEILNIQIKIGKNFMNIKSLLKLKNKIFILKQQQTTIEYTRHQHFQIMNHLL
jgi:hypothetical protein